jgi:hypothetical protein
MSNIPFTDPCWRLVEQAVEEYQAGHLARACELARQALECYRAADRDIPPELVELLDRACGQQ